MVTINKEERERRYNMVRNYKAFRAGETFTSREIRNDLNVDRYFIGNLLSAMVADHKLERIDAPYQSAPARYRRPIPSILSKSWRHDEELYELIERQPGCR